MKRFLSQFFIVIAVMMLLPFAALANEKGVSGEQMTYVVKKGDTLSKIAFHHHTTWPKLVKLNRIKDPDLIFPRQVLLLREQKGLHNAKTAQVQKVATAKSGVTAVSPIGTRTQNATVPCDPESAIAQLQFPASVEQELIGKVKAGQYEDIIDQENIPNEHARKYVARDSENEYAFTYPDSCTWRKKSVQAHPGKDALLKIPTSPNDRNENGQLLALPLGPTPGNVVQENEELPKERKSGLIVLVRYLSHCSAEYDCEARQAKGELYMQRE